MVANTNMATILAMFFLTICNANLLFVEQDFIWRSYISVQALLTIKYIKIINKKDFDKAALNRNSKIFVIDIAILKALLAGITIHFS